MILCVMTCAPCIFSPSNVIADCNRCYSWQISHWQIIFGQENADGRVWEWIPSRCNSEFLYKGPLAASLVLEPPLLPCLPPSHCLSFSIFFPPFSPLSLWLVGCNLAVLHVCISAGHCAMYFQHKAVKEPVWV